VALSIAFDHDQTSHRFRLVVDGEERTMPELGGEELSRWLPRLGRVIGKGASAITDAEAAGDLVGTLRADMETQEDLIDALMAYDRTGELGSRDWVETHLTDEQLLLILQRIQAVHA
jgi:hypothetical protein